MGSIKLSDIAILILAAIAIVLAVLLQMEKIQTSSLQDDVIKLEVSIKTTERLNAEAAKTLKAQHERELARAKVESLEQQLLLKEKLNEIQAKYLAGLTDVDSMRKQISSINSKLADLSRTSLESYATTAGNNLVEAAGVTVELEKLAYSYYNEREYYRGQLENLKVVPSLILTDEKTGATTSLTSITRIKAGPEDFIGIGEVVAP